MNNTDLILRMLTNSGFRVLGFDGTYIHLEDPFCVLRSFEIFINYAWIAITAITGLLLFGWAISMIRGAKNELLINLRNLTIIFGILSAIKPVVNFVWGGDLFARGCKTIDVSLAEVNKLLDTRNSKLSDPKENDIYEDLEISDSYTLPDGPKLLPYSDAPLTSAGQPGKVITTTSGMAAAESGRDVIYTDKDGRKYKRTGGTRAWRNNNPGNITFSEFAKKAGAIGSAGGFAVFSDERIGMSAIKSLLQTNKYNSLTVAGAISRYAPPSENDTSSYQRRIEQLTNISVNTPMNQLNDSQLENVANAIRQIEGWKPGREVEL